MESGNATTFLGSRTITTTSNSTTIEGWTSTTTTTTKVFKPALSSAHCSPYALQCKGCYERGCILCEVGPELSYWDAKGTGKEGTPAGQHDWACIMQGMKCETLRYMRPNTHFTKQVAYHDCDKVFTTPKPAPSIPVTRPPAVRAPDPEPQAKWSGNPGDWGVVQWTVIGMPLMVLFGVALAVFCSMRKAHSRRLQRVAVAPQQNASGKETVEWGMFQAGRLSVAEVQKVLKAVREAEKADGKVGPRARHLVFGERNDLKAEHLRVLGVLLDHHPQVTLSLDTDWRLSDDASLKALVGLLHKRERCRLVSPETDESTLRLPPSTGLNVVDELAAALTSSSHPEVDAIAFAPPGAWPPPHSVKSSPVIALTQLRQSSQELVLRRCAMADLGTAAVCAFVRPWAPRIQHIRLTECEIGDEGAVALSRLLGPHVRELCLTSNCISDRGITEIAKALPMADSLERLLLDRNSIGDAGATMLGAHLLRSNVSELTLGSHLGGNLIGEEGVAALAKALDDELPRAAANRAGRLCSLNLDGCIVGDYGAKALASHLPKSAIMALSIARGQCSNDGADAIIAALPRSCLSLDLSGNGLSDRVAMVVAEAFYRIPQLAVSLANNHLTVGLRAILHEEHGSRLRL